MVEIEIYRVEKGMQGRKGDAGKKREGKEKGREGMKREGKVREGKRKKGKEKGRNNVMG